jgi:membrane protein required for colicin V production
MTEFPLTLADLAVIGVVLISGLLAFFRGLVREVLAVAAWIGAGFVTLYAFKPLRPHARQLIGIELAADAAVIGGVFIATLIVLSLISHAIGNRVQGSRLGAIDRSLGFLFGIARGAVLLALALLVVDWAVPRESRPDWIKSARTTPWIERGADLLLSLVPREARVLGSAAADEARRRAETAAETKRSYDRLVAPVPQSAPSKPDASQTATGYNKEERRGLDRLFQSSQ